MSIESRLPGRGIAAGCLVALMIGCGEGERNVVEAPLVADTAEASAGPPATAGAPTVLFVGTSLTAGLGVAPDQAFPALIQEKVDSAGLPFTVVNGGVSGETSAGALGRIDWILRQPFDVLVLETGANDMLRGQLPSATASNIQAIIERVREARPEAEIVLAGMRAAPNLGARYVREFEAIYPDLARKHDLRLLPFLLEGVAAVPELNQGDGMHPNPRGHRLIADQVWVAIAPMLESYAE